MCKPVKTCQSRSVTRYIIDSTRPITRRNPNFYLPKTRSSTVKPRTRTVGFFRIGWGVWLVRLRG
ncbi:MAG: hypothetical protein WC015_09210 [Methanoregula sp.]